MLLSRRFLVPLLLLLLVVAAGATACTSGKDAEAAEESTDRNAAEQAAEEGTEEEEAVPVTLAVARRGRIEALLRATANLEAERQVQVYSQATGIVTRLAAEEGDHLRRGDLLVQLDDRQARSAVAKAESRLRRQRRETDRIERLWKKKLVSEQDFSEARYQLEQLELELADARRDLEYTSVRTPIDGTIAKRSVQLGERVQAGAPLFEIVDFDSLVARIFVPEKDLSRLALGQVGRISSRSLGKTVYSGRVQRISPVIDPATGTAKVTLAVGDQPGLRPGMYVDVALVTRVEEDAVLVPKQAVIYDRDRAWLFRIDDQQRAHKVEIEIELADRESVKPAAGIQAGDRLVTAGQTGLKEGARITEVPATSSGA